MQLSVALQGIMTQQLLPTADGSSRVVGCEVLVPTPAVRNLIREGKTHQILSAMQTGAGVGMQTMDSALAQLVRAGKITRRLAEERSSTPEELRRLLGGGVGGSAGGVDHGHLRLQGDGPHRRQGDRARSRPRASRSSPTSSSSAG